MPLYPSQKAERDRHNPDAHAVEVRQAPAPYFPPTGMPYPRCARCRHQVRRMDHWQDSKTRELVFRVFCHGEMDIIRMPAVPPAPGTFFTIGEAFQPKLTPPDDTKKLFKKLLEVPKPQRAIRSTRLIATERHTVYCVRCEYQASHYGAEADARKRFLKLGWAFTNSEDGEFAFCASCQMGQP